MVVVHVGARKKYLEALRRKERGVNITVVPLFLFERTSGPVLTFKYLCDGSPGMGLSQILSKFEPFNSGFMTFFQFQESLDLIFEPDLIHVHSTHSRMLKIMCSVYLWTFEKK
jgi:hypothetical protein